MVEPRFRSTSTRLHVLILKKRYIIFFELSRDYFILENLFDPPCIWWCMIIIYLLRFAPQISRILIWLSDKIRCQSADWRFIYFSRFYFCPYYIYIYFREVILLFPNGHVMKYEMKYVSRMIHNICQMIVAAHTIKLYKKIIVI